MLEPKEDLDSGGCPCNIVHQSVSNSCLCCIYPQLAERSTDAIQEKCNNPVFDHI
uniref:Uncharacterized protein n=1 Tax=Arundo donax TaxID=35708 RepID=A0A0A9G829_ARUDO